MPPKQSVTTILLALALFGWSPSRPPLAEASETLRPESSSEDPGDSERDSRRERLKKKNKNKEPRSKTEIKGVGEKSEPSKAEPEEAEKSKSP